MPVVTFDTLASAVPTARALVAGGIRAIEVTLRTPVALDAIRAIVTDVPQMSVGAGTILRSADLKAALASGARFGLSPGATPELLAAARASPLPFIPGVATASELMSAMDLGFSTVKFFPAEAAGGVAALQALAAPFPQARFCPTGGITLAAAPRYLALPCVIGLGGSWLTPRDVLARGDYAAIEAAACAAAALTTHA
jgi:2-dehydro-3-deoxyphosphogluconate aldolase/(4S)-4-hydroxy-2-oxoglutarate aldolase